MQKQNKNNNYKKNHPTLDAILHTTKIQSPGAVGLQATPYHRSQMFACNLRRNHIDLWERRKHCYWNQQHYLGLGNSLSCKFLASGKFFRRRDSTCTFCSWTFPEESAFTQCHCCAKLENLNRKLGNRSKVKSNYKGGKNKSKGQVKGSETCKTWKEERQLTKILWIWPLLPEGTQVACGDFPV